MTDDSTKGAGQPAPTSAPAKEAEIVSFLRAIGALEGPHATEQLFILFLASAQMQCPPGHHIGLTLADVKKAAGLLLLGQDVLKVSVHSDGLVFEVTSPQAAHADATAFLKSVDKQAGGDIIVGGVSLLDDGPDEGEDKDDPTLKEPLQ